MLIRIIKGIAAALFYLLLYYICQALAVFAFGMLDAAARTVIGSVLFCAAVYAVFWYRHINPADRLKIKPTELRTSAELIIFGAAFNVVCTVVIAFIPFPQEMINAYIDASSEIEQMSAVSTFLLTVIAAPITEELLFRGLIFANLCRAFHVLPAAIVSAALFGAAHSSPIWMLYAAFFGCILAAIYEKHQNLTASVLFHLGFNTAGFILGEATVSGTALLIMFITSVFFVQYGVYRLLLGKRGRINNFVQNLRKFTNKY